MSKQDEDGINLLGLRVERKTDILAFAAFLIALLGTCLQIADWAKGPRISFHGPDRVVLFTYLQQNGLQIVRVAAPMSYTNSATSQYSGTLRSERVNMTIGAHSTTQAWFSFGRLATRGVSFEPEISADASPQTIPGGGAISHTTFFTALPITCTTAKPKCERYANFSFDGETTTDLGKVDHISFVFLAEMYDAGAPQSYGCSVAVDADILAHWLANGWFSAPCEPVDRS